MNIFFLIDAFSVIEDDVINQMIRIARDESAKKEVQLVTKIVSIESDVDLINPEFIENKRRMCSPIVILFSDGHNQRLTALDGIIDELESILNNQIIKIAIGVNGTEQRILSQFASCSFIDETFEKKVPMTFDIDDVQTIERIFRSCIGILPEWIYDDGSEEDNSDLDISNEDIPELVSWDSWE